MSKWTENSPLLERLVQKKKLSENELIILKPQVNNIIRNNIEEICFKLGLKLTRSGSNLRCACPIHGGDNQKGFSINVVEFPGLWTCWTHHCEKGNRSPLRLVELITNLPTEDAMRFVLDSTDSRDIEFKHIEIKDYEHNETRSEIRSQLEIPAKYYIEKGIDPLLLDMLDVGYCNDGKMVGRVVFPIYDITDKYIGSTGRITYKSQYAPKWKHVDIRTGNHLYNINKAAIPAKEHKTIFIVESTGNVLKMMQNGINNCVATFGAHLSEQQLIKLECLDINKVNILFDNDEAGKLAAERAKEKIKFDSEIITIEENDVFDMSNEKVKELRRYM